MYGLTRAEIRLLRSLSTPQKVQRYLDDLKYNVEPHGDTLRSPRRVMRDRTAHCAEGAFLAAAAFRVNGRPPLLVDLEADRDDDHVLAVYRDRGLWGSVATSKFSGLRFRAPVYRTVRELVMSYFEDYFNWGGQRTLRAYSRPLSLKRFDGIGWMTAEEDLWPVVEWLAVAHHTPLVGRAVARRCRGSTAAPIRRAFLGLRSTESARFPPQAAALRRGDAAHGLGRRTTPLAAVRQRLLRDRLLRVHRPGRR